jgi:SPP1 gp7 family putative phage head morphogenesis protein
MYNRSTRFLQKFVVKKEDLVLEFDPESFTMPNPQAEAWLMTYSGKEIRDISQQNLDNIRQILYRGQRDKQTNAVTAKQLRSAIGLNSKQEIAFNNYRNNLSRSGKTDAQIKTLSDKYYNKLLRYRAETIALTESHTATNKAWSDSVKEFVKDDLLDPNVYALYWLTAPDERRCPSCGAMAGTEADLTTQSFKGQNPPPLHPRCRCTTIVKRKK